MQVCADTTLCEDVSARGFQCPRRPWTRAPAGAEEQTVPCIDTIYTSELFCFVIFFTGLSTYILYAVTLVCCSIQGLE